MSLLKNNRKINWLRTCVDTYAYRDADDYNPNDVDRQKSVGVDFGIKELAVLSTGKVFAVESKPQKTGKTSTQFCKESERFKSSSESQAYDSKTSLSDCKSTTSCVGRCFNSVNL